MKMGMWSVASVLLVAGMAQAQMGVSNPEIKREGSGERRLMLNKMELKAAATDLWAGLSNWTGGPALTSEATKGKVVVVLTWAAWHPVSQQALNRAQSLVETFGKDGVIVVAAHDARRFEDGVKLGKEKAAGVLMAQDEKGVFRKALSSEQDPNFYVIDRAGQMRFADIETGSVEAAVKLLVAETAETAAMAPKKLADVQSAAAAAAGKTRAVAGNATARAVRFAMPDATAYERAAWPAKNEKDLNATNKQGEKLPGADTFGQRELWITEKPTLAGKIMVLDFWAVWCGPCKAAMPMLDDLQAKNRDDLAIIGIAGQGEEMKVVERYLQGHTSSYYHCYDGKQVIYNAMSISAIPHVVVVSTDGVIRWQGNPHSAAFRKAVELAIAVDPGVNARKRAEAKAAGG